MNTIESGKICLALAPGGAQDMLIKVLSLNSAFRTEYLASTGVPENYSVFEHSSMALNQFKRYSMGVDLPQPRDPMSHHIGCRGVEFALATHDLAKFSPGEAKNPHAEHARTLQLLAQHRQFLPFSDLHSRIIFDLINNDTLGNLFRNTFVLRPPWEEKKEIMLRGRESPLSSEEYHRLVDRWERDVSASIVSADRQEFLLQECAAEFRQRASSLGVPVDGIFKPSVVFFLSDVSSYSADAYVGSLNGTPSLDYMLKRSGSECGPGLFKLSSHWQRLEMSPAYEQVYLKLEKLLLK